MNNKVILITQYFKVKNSNAKYIDKRQNEINTCLIKNCENNYIDKIHLFIEDDVDINFINKYQNKFIVIKHNQRITFKDIFEYYNNNLANFICILLNSDIFLDDSIQIVKHINFNNLFLALNRYENNNNKCNLLNGLEVNDCIKNDCSYLTPYQPSIWSQDGWIWKSKYINLDDSYNFLLGSVGCDNHIAYLLDKKKYIICNPSSLICLNHFDVLSIDKNIFGISKGNVSKNRENRIGNMSTYLFLENIDDIPDKYTINFIKEVTDKNIYICKYKFIKNISKININESQIISSSFLNDVYKPFNCLFEETGFWQPDLNDKNPYIEFNFENLYEIAVIDIKGKHVDKDDIDIGFIKKFKISYQNNLINNKWINDDTVYDAINTINGNFIKRIYLENNITCSKIRIYPIDYYNMNTFKIRFYKLNYNKYDILNNLNIYIDKTKFTSTYFDYKYFEELQTKYNCFQKYEPIKHNTNILNEEILDGICIIVCVMNRRNNILNNINSWLKQKINQLIILDWSSKNNFYNDIKKLNDDRILYVYVNNETKYIRTYAQNLAANLCKYDKICKIDSDIILSDNFFENHTYFGTPTPRASIKPETMNATISFGYKF